ncbi:MAG TPA: cytochrome c oxidase assembly protein [Acidimicrobiia bacterium]
MYLPPFHVHADVITILFLLTFSYLYAVNRLGPILAPNRPTSGKTQAVYLVGVATIWIASGWPIHDIAERYLFSVHMVQHILLEMVAPPLLLLGLPSWLADRVFGNRFVLPWLRPIARMVPAFFISTGLLLFIHWPKIVELQVTSHFAHFLIHAALLGAGVLMWFPVCSTATLIPRARPPMQMVYLFSHSILPTVPASFLTFSTVALYPAYGNAAEVYGLTALADQALAGVIMKIIGGLYLWGWIAVIWFRWASAERRWDEIEQELATTQ